MSALPTVHLGPLTDLDDVLAADERVLIITGASRRYLAQVVESLKGRQVAAFDGARRHVPEQSVHAALTAFDQHRASTVISVGGGSTTGVAKALRLQRSFRFIAVPTTYAGSEFTNLYGITTENTKQTGRDDAVVPDLILVDVALTREMPKPLTIASLLNALAHPVSLLSTELLSTALANAQPASTALSNTELSNTAPTDAERALRAAQLVYECVEQLLLWPENEAARQAAVGAAGDAARALQFGKPGLQHRLAHALGGRFDLDHSALHALLLPHTLRDFRQTAPSAFEVLRERLGEDDPEAMVFDALVRSGNPTSLRALGVDFAAFQQYLEAQPELPSALLFAAYHGRKPSLPCRRQDWGLRQEVTLWGPEPSHARRVVVALHGRGSSAEAILARVLQVAGDDPTLCVVAPQAPNGSWFEGNHVDRRAALVNYDHSLAEGLQLLERVKKLAPLTPLVLFGFSQGACLAFDVFAQHGKPLAALVALSGAAIGGMTEPWRLPETVGGTEALIGASADDGWLTSEEAAWAERTLLEAGCKVTVVRVPGSTHTLHARHRVLARALVRGEGTLAPGGGFGAHHESEDLKGALPSKQNSPRNVPYGLYAEQVNATGFVAERSLSLRSWLYRIRPTALHTPFAPLTHPRFTTDFKERSPEINLAGFRPLALPEKPTDFVDGLATIGGAGAPELRRGFAVHVYAANSSMEDRCFCNADGELLLLPELGRVTLLTELGALNVGPGQLALIPRGIRFSVLLDDGPIRGYVGEVYGRCFQLPDRGPVGANGLTEARHFRAPAAYHEDRLSPGYRVTQKLAGTLYEARQDHSPYDVVAWHGNLTPYCYDLDAFSPVGNVSFDHGDPSVHTVLSAAMDERGSHALDFVLFAPRWDPTENTFRPPYFHRNATTEFNGILKDQPSSLFSPGCYFLTPCLTPHGVLAKSVERALHSSKPEAPARAAQRSYWFQFETALPFSFSNWAASAPNRVQDWACGWGVYRTHFRV